MKTKKPFMTRCLALMVALTFLTSEAAWGNASINLPAPAISTGSPFNIDQIRIPESIGTVETITVQRNSAQPPVIVIQDAHAVIDAQQNIREIIQYLQSEYGIRRFAVEGGKGKLDPLLLRTFPDPRVKKKVMSSYLEHGELSGSELAAILNTEEGQYEGMENWPLYEANYIAFLRAKESEPVFVKLLDAVEAELDRERRQIFSKGLNEFYEKIKAFQKENAYLLELLGYLGSLEDAKLRLSQYPELYKLYLSFEFENNSAGDKEGMEVRLRQMADDFKSRFIKRMNIKQEMEFHKNYQAFVTGQMQAADFLRYVIDLGSSFGVKARLTPAMLSMLGHSETLSAIKGTKLFDELEMLIREFENSLITHPQEKSLVERYRRLGVVRNLAALELPRDQWDLFDQDREGFLAGLEEKWRSIRGKENPASVEELAGAAVEFYRLALGRDEAFRGHVAALAARYPQEPIGVIAGGFHTDGFERSLKEEGFSFAVVTPKIKGLDGQQWYEDVMWGKVSYRQYLKTTLYDAFARDAAIKFSNELNEPEFRRNIKLWRDEVLRKLADEGRIVQARKYTRYIDLLYKNYSEKYGRGRRMPATREEALNKVREELNDFRDSQMGRLWNSFENKLAALTEGIEGLINKREMTAENVLSLINRSSEGQRAVLSPSVTKLVEGGRFEALERLTRGEPLDAVIRSIELPSGLVLPGERVITAPPTTPIAPLRNIQLALLRVAGNVQPSANLLNRNEIRELAGRVGGLGATANGLGRNPEIGFRPPSPEETQRGVDADLDQLARTLGASRQEVAAAVLLSTLPETGTILPAQNIPAVVQQPEARAVIGPVIAETGRLEIPQGAEAPAPPAARPELRQPTDRLGPFALQNGVNSILGGENVFVQGIYSDPEQGGSRIINYIESLKTTTEDGRPVIPRVLRIYTPDLASLSYGVRSQLTESADQGLFEVIQVKNEADVRRAAAELGIPAENFSNELSQNRRFLFVSELIEGPSARDELQRSQGNEALQAEIGENLAANLQALHAAGLVAGDTDLTKFVIGEEGFTYRVDLGKIRSFDNLAREGKDPEAEAFSEYTVIASQLRAFPSAQSAFLSGYDIAQPLPVRSEFRMPALADTAGAGSLISPIPIQEREVNDFILENILARASRGLNESLNDARNAGAGAAVERLAALTELVDDQLMPLAGDVDGFIDSLALYDAPPAGYANVADLARARMAELAGIEGRQIVFVDPNDPIWIVLGYNFRNPPAGTVVTVSSRTGRVRKQVLLIRNDRSELDTLLTLAHEVGHAQQSFRALRRYRDPLFRAIVEGYQQFREKEIIRNLGLQNDELGGRIRQLVDQAYRQPSRKEQLFYDIYGVREEGVEGFQDQLDRLYDKYLPSRNYPYESLFVNILIEQAGEGRVRELYEKGTFRQVRNALGQKKFDSLRLFFRQWEISEALQKPLGSAGLDGKKLAFRLAERILLKPPYSEERAGRLLDFTAELNRQILALPDTPQLDELARKSRGNQLIPALVQAAHDYASGDLSREGLRSRLDEIIADAANTGGELDWDLLNARLNAIPVRSERRTGEDESQVEIGKGISTERKQVAFQGRTFANATEAFLYVLLEMAEQRQLGADLIESISDLLQKTNYDFNVITEVTDAVSKEERPDKLSFDKKVEVLTKLGLLSQETVDSLKSTKPSANLSKNISYDYKSRIGVMRIISALLTSLRQMGFDNDGLSAELRQLQPKDMIAQFKALKLRETADVREKISILIETDLEKLSQLRTEIESNNVSQEGALASLQAFLEDMTVYDAPNITPYISFNLKTKIARMLEWFIENAKNKDRTYFNEVASLILLFAYEHNILLPRLSERKVVGLNPIVEAIDRVLPNFKKALIDSRDRKQRQLLVRREQDKVDHPIISAVDELALPIPDNILPKNNELKPAYPFLWRDEDPLWDAPSESNWNYRYLKGFDVKDFMRPEANMDKLELLRYRVDELHQRGLVDFLRERLRRLFFNSAVTVKTIIIRGSYLYGHPESKGTDLDVTVLIEVKGDGKFPGNNGEVVRIEDGYTLLDQDLQGFSFSEQFRRAGRSVDRMDLKIRTKTDPYATMANDNIGIFGGGIIIFGEPMMQYRPADAMIVAKALDLIRDAGQWLYTVGKGGTEISRRMSATSKFGKTLKRLEEANKALKFADEDSLHLNVSGNLKTDSFYPDLDDFRSRVFDIINSDLETREKERQVEAATAQFKNLVYGYFMSSIEAAVSMIEHFSADNEFTEKYQYGFYVTLHDILAALNQYAERPLQFETDPKVREIYGRIREKVKSQRMNVLREAVAKSPVVDQVRFELRDDAAAALTRSELRAEAPAREVAMTRSEYQNLREFAAALWAYTYESKSALPRRVEEMISNDAPDLKGRMAAKGVSSAVRQGLRQAAVDLWVRMDGGIPPIRVQQDIVYFPRDAMTQLLNKLLNLRPYLQEIGSNDVGSSIITVYWGQAIRVLQKRLNVQPQPQGQAPSKPAAATPPVEEAPASAKIEELPKTILMPQKKAAASAPVVPSAPAGEKTEELPKTELMPRKGAAAGGRASDTAPQLRVAPPKPKAQQPAKFSRPVLKLTPEAERRRARLHINNLTMKHPQMPGQDLYPNKRGTFKSWMITLIKGTGLYNEEQAEKLAEKFTQQIFVVDPATQQFVYRKDEALAQNFMSFMREFMASAVFGRLGEGRDANARIKSNAYIFKEVIRVLSSYDVYPPNYPPEFGFPRTVRHLASNRSKNGVYTAGQIYKAFADSFIELGNIIPAYEDPDNPGRALWSNNYEDFFKALQARRGKQLTDGTVLTDRRILQILRRIKDEGAAINLPDERQKRAAAKAARRALIDREYMPLLAAQPAAVVQPTATPPKLPPSGAAAATPARATLPVVQPPSSTSLPEPAGATPPVSVGAPTPANVPSGDVIGTEIDAMLAGGNVTPAARPESAQPAEDWSLPMDDESPTPLPESPQAKSDLTDPKSPAAAGDSGATAGGQVGGVTAPAAAPKSGWFANIFSQRPRGAAALRQQQQQAALDYLDGKTQAPEATEDVDWYEATAVPEKPKKMTWGEWVRSWFAAPQEKTEAPSEPETDESKRTPRQRFGLKERPPRQTVLVQVMDDMGLTFDDFKRDGEIEKQSIDLVKVQIPSRSTFVDKVDALLDSLDSLAPEMAQHVDRLETLTAAMESEPYHKEIAKHQQVLSVYRKRVTLAIQYVNHRLRVLVPTTNRAVDPRVVQAAGAERLERAKNHRIQLNNLIKQTNALVLRSNDLTKKVTALRQKAGRGLPRVIKRPRDASDKAVAASKKFFDDLEKGDAAVEKKEDTGFDWGALTRRQAQGPTSAVDMPVIRSVPSRDEVLRQADQLKGKEQAQRRTAPGASRARAARPEIRGETAGDVLARANVSNWNDFANQVNEWVRNYNGIQELELPRETIAFANNVIRLTPETGPEAGEQIGFASDPDLGDFLRWVVGDTLQVPVEPPFDILIEQRPSATAGEGTDTISRLVITPARSEERDAIDFDKIAVADLPQIGRGGMTVVYGYQPENSDTSYAVLQYYVRPAEITNTESLPSVVPEEWKNIARRVADAVEAGDLEALKDLLVAFQRFLIQDSLLPMINRNGMRKDLPSVVPGAVDNEVMNIIREMLIMTEKALLDIEPLDPALMNQAVTNLQGRLALRPPIVVQRLFPPGKDLNDVLRAQPNWSDRQRLAIAYSIARALQYLHAVGVNHRDIKPENVWIPNELIENTDWDIDDLWDPANPETANFPSPMIIDFGLSGLNTSGLGLDDASLDLAGKFNLLNQLEETYVMGTPEYMPRRFDQPDFNGSNDRNWYAFGVLVADLFGANLYRGIPGNDIIGMTESYQIAQLENTLRERIQDSDLPEDVKALVASVVQPDLSQLPAESGIIAALERALENQPPQSQRIPVSGPSADRLARFLGQPGQQPVAAAAPARLSQDSPFNLVPGADPNTADGLQQIEAAVLDVLHGNPALRNIPRVSVETMNQNNFRIYFQDREGNPIRALERKTNQPAKTNVDVQVDLKTRAVNAITATAPFGESKEETRLISTELLRTMLLFLRRQGFVSVSFNELNTSSLGFFAQVLADFGAADNGQNMMLEMLQFAEDNPQSGGRLQYRIDLDRLRRLDASASEVAATIASIARDNTLRKLGEKRQTPQTFDTQTRQDKRSEFREEAAAPTARISRIDDFRALWDTSGMQYEDFLNQPAEAVIRLVVDRFREAGRQRLDRVRSGFDEANEDVIAMLEDQLKTLVELMDYVWSPAFDAEILGRFNGFVEAGILDSTDMDALVARVRIALTAEAEWQARAIDLELTKALERVDAARMAEFEQNLAEAIDALKAGYRTQKMVLTINYPEVSQQPAVLESLKSFAGLIERLEIIHDKTQPIDRAAIQGFRITTHSLDARTTMGDALQGVTKTTSRLNERLAVALTANPGADGAFLRDLNIAVIEIEKIDDAKLKKLAYSSLLYVLFRLANESAENLAKLRLNPELLKNYIKEDDILSSVAAGFGIGKNGVINLNISQFVEAFAAIEAVAKAA